MNLSFNSKRVSITFAVLVGAGLIYFLAGTSGSKSKGNRIEKVTRGDLLQRITVAGTVIPARRTVITAPYKGYVKKIFVKLGDQIQAGAPIVSVIQSLTDTDPVFPLRAPFAGTVVQVEKAEGEFVKEGDPKDFIVRIDDLSKLYVTASAPEMDRVKMKLGQSAVLKASAILNKKYKGIVRELALAAQEKDTWARSQSQVEYTVRTEIVDADSELKPGMSVLMDIITEKKEATLILPHEFIAREKDKYFVTLKNGEKKAIEVGIQNEDSFEILSGVNEGDLIQQVDFASMQMPGR